MSANAQSRPSSGKAPSLRLVSSNGEPVSEAWDDLPDNALVTFTMPKKVVSGAWYGIGNMMEANTNMIRAVEAARNGDEAGFEKHVHRAQYCMWLGCSFAADVYRHTKEKARRANAPRSKPSEGRA